MNPDSNPWKQLSSFLIILLGLSLWGNVLFWRQAVQLREERDELQEQIDDNDFQDFDRADQGSDQEEENKDDERSELSSSEKKELEAVIDDLKVATEEIRGLTWQEDIEVQFMDRNDLKEELLGDELDEEAQELLQISETQLKTLGLIPEDYDYYQEQLNLFEEQVGGFYDPETKELYLIGDQELSFLDKVIIVHELTHALQDQYYDLNQIQEDLEEDPEASFAFTSLVEGDATLVMQEYVINYATPSDTLSIATEIEDYDQTVLDRTPEALQSSFNFPYEEGFLFVQAIFAQGGWDAINKTYASLPTSSEQILHPERYLGNEVDTPVTVEVEDISEKLAGDWELVDEGVMGEFSWLLILDEGLRSRDAEEAAEGWGGDYYHFYQNKDDQSLYYIQSTWDSTSDAREFTNALEEQFQSLQDDDRFEAFSIERDGRDVTIWLGPEGIEL